MHDHVSAGEPMVQHIPSLQGTHPQGQRKEECTPYPVNPPFGPDQPDEGREGHTRTCNAQKDGVLCQGPRRKGRVGEHHETNRFTRQTQHHRRQELSSRLGQDDQGECEEGQKGVTRCGHQIGWEKDQRKPAKRRQCHRQVKQVATMGMDTMACHAWTGVCRVSCHNRMPNVARKLNRAPRS